MVERKTDKQGKIECKECHGTGVFRPQNELRCAECDVGCICEFCGGEGKVLWVDDVLNRKKGRI